MEFWIALSILGLTVWLWHDNLRARELAFRECQRACQSMGAQLLDQSVSLRRVGFKRGQDGWLRLKRGYAFEFSLNGANRYPGIAVLSREKVEYLRLEHPDGAVIMGAEGV